MKKYLEIYVGSRGLIEGIAEMEIDNIEDYLQKEMNENLEGMDWDEDEDEDYIEEMESLWEWEKIDNGYYLGLGDEEVKYYIDMENELLKEWIKNNEDDNVNGETFWNWNDLANEKIYDILDKVLGY
jgi:hypothetical protein